MQLMMLGPPGPAPPAANAPGLALGHQLSTPGSRPAGPPGQGEIFAEAIAAAVAAAQSGVTQPGNASQPEESHGASLLARLLLGSTSGEAEPEGDATEATEATHETTQPDRTAGVGIGQGRAAAALAAVGTGVDVGAVMSQRTAVTTPVVAVTAPVTTTGEPVAAAPSVAGASAVIAPQGGTAADVAVTTEAATVVDVVSAAAPASEGAPNGEPSAPMAETPVETPVEPPTAETPVETPGDDDGPTADADGVEQMTFEAPGKSVTRGKAGDAPRSARAAMVSAVTGEPGRAAAAQGLGRELDRGVGKRPAEAPAPAAAAAAAKGGEAQSPVAAPAPLATQEVAATTGAASVDGPQVAGRIAELVHSAVMRGDSEVRLVLNPPELGRVDIRIVDTPDGLVVAMQAANGEARELISRALVSLQVALEGRELRVDRLTVDQPSQQSQDEPGRQGQRGEDGRQQGRDGGRDGESNGNGFGARNEEARDASSGTPPGRRVETPAGVRHDGALNLVA